MKPTWKKGRLRIDYYDRLLKTKQALLVSKQRKRHKNSREIKNDRFFYLSIYYTVHPIYWMYYIHYGFYVRKVLLPTLYKGGNWDPLR